jgi:hypothetical protein
MKISAAILATAAAIAMTPISIARSETAIIDTVVYGCPDWDYQNKRTAELFSDKSSMAIQQSDERAYKHGCHTFTNGDAGEIVGKKGMWTQFRPCGWSQPFWISSLAKDHLRLDGDRCP